MDQPSSWSFCLSFLVIITNGTLDITNLLKERFDSITSVHNWNEPQSNCIKLGES
jgi:hypothetical protein